ncbi:FUSC family protein [Alteromonas lipolytica]|uniref:Integral membrane bound transporter domain-containing protein n=1 Tax=Alteromonas lipolytica TaxID=1856405 RepID=A0A1E8FCH8_9ALTE|nr:FUSC family protein [Alteromonas lipolytica]OFI33621.1 hypothetical protein BFC17_04555 [Alteromonas lipolytica]
MNLVHPQQFKESVQLAPQPSLRNDFMAGLQTGLTAVIALTLAYLSPWSEMVGFAGLGALIALFARHSSHWQRHWMLLLAAVIQTGMVFIMSSVAYLEWAAPLQLGLLSVVCGVLMFICSSTALGAPGPLIFVFAAGACVGSEPNWPQVVDRTMVTGAAALLGWFICLCTSIWRHVPKEEEASAQIRPLHNRLVAALRITIGACFAIFLVRYGFQAHYPAWAAMGALAVMQGAHLHLSMNRALQRMVGTTIGAVVAWFLLIQEPSIWTLIGVIGIFQLLTEIFIGSNYALGQMFIAPMALLTMHLAAPWVSSAAMVPERVLDTVVGACIGMVIAVLFSSLDDRRFLAQLRGTASRGQQAH